MIEDQHTFIDVARVGDGRVLIDAAGIYQWLNGCARNVRRENEPGELFTTDEVASCLERRAQSILDVIAVTNMEAAL